MTLTTTIGMKKVKNPPVEKWVWLNEDIKNAVIKLIDEGVMSIGDHSGIQGEFEDRFAGMVGTRYALTMNSGTATLHSAFFAVGVGPGDEVIVPTYTWHATITPILHCAATPVFCDMDPKSLTIDPDDIERKITPRTKAICVVHIFGNVCNMDRIVEICKRHKIALIEDCSHAHGAKWRGKPVGSFGSVGCFSLQGAKAVSGGEAGVATTDDPELMDRMILLGHFGRSKIGVNKEINNVGDMALGIKYRPHGWACAMANVQLQRLPELNRLRTRNYTFLNDKLRNCPGLEVVDPLPGAERAAYLEFKFKLSEEIVSRFSRQTIVDAMNENGVPVTSDRYSDFNYTYGLLHTAPLFTTFDLRSVGGCFYDPTLTPEEEKKVRTPVSLPVSEGMAKRLFSLPPYTDVTLESLEELTDAMIEVMENVNALAK